MTKFEAQSLRVEFIGRMDKIQSKQSFSLKASDESQTFQ